MTSGPHFGRGRARSKSESDLVGLTDAEVLERVRRGQTNDVPQTTSRTLLQIVRANVLTPFNALLGGLLVVILVVGPIQDALFGGVLVANALVGIVQELRAKRTLDRLAVLTAPRARAVREGEVREIPVGGVVLDDVLEVRPGDQIVVDGDLVTSNGLEIDESLLTGESEPVSKETGDTVLSGSFAAAGSGRYRATRIGRAAYAHVLGERARRFTRVNSELRTGINRIIVMVTCVLLPTATLLFVSQLGSLSSPQAALRGAVAGTVAMVPEGLVLLTSVAFAVGVVRLGQRSVLVQELPAIEGLARVDVLCTDKTGTLTEGRLAVDGVEPVGGEARVEEALAALAAADPSPNATMLAIGSAFGDSARRWPLIAAVPFSSTRKWSGASFDGFGAWVLGAPDVLLDARNAEAVRARAGELAAEGRRVLLLGRAPGGITGEELPREMEPAALVILRDRVRSDAPEILRYFAQRGVAVKLITGDHLGTAIATADQAGLKGSADAVDGRDLPDDPALLAHAVEQRSVFGRVTPEQKRAMIVALRSRGHVVAMTGDGVNDVLALKEADIGVAMASGSPAARATAQLVLLDSSFASLPSVVDEGRRVLTNIERTANLFLTKTVYAMLLALAVGVLQLPFPFLPRQLTLVGTLTIGIPGFFLALAPDASRARPGFVGRVLRFAVPAGLMAAAATLAAYGLIRGEGVDLEEARTVATVVLFWIGLVVLTMVAVPLTLARRALVVATGVAFLAVMAIPSIRGFFALSLPSGIEWLAAVGIAAIVATGLRLLIPDRDQPRASDAPT
ncbi:MAG TPA: HAD-IC family P-type ATPase [Actinomycetota bacterium]|nr:HAD-IC family P-type ATPase [Actinomycetota bacterium]